MSFFSFILTSILLGVGLAMDAFSVSLANGLAEPQMKPGRTSAIAGIYAFFQAAMPLTGWYLVHAAATRFTAFQKYIPYIALILLLFIGGKMLWESLFEKEQETKVATLGIGTLLLQGVATSIDALSVGFTIADYDLPEALTAALIIAAVTFVICVAGLCIGKKFGTKLAGKAGILGGVILILIGVEIFLSGIGVLNI